MLASRLLRPVTRLSTCFVPLRPALTPVSFITRALSTPSDGVDQPPTSDVDAQVNVDADEAASADYYRRAKEYIESMDKKEEKEEPSLYKLRERSVDDLGRSYGTGRRKTSIARVWVSPGSGRVTVNGDGCTHYFSMYERLHALEPLLASGAAGDVDVMATVQGGGKSGQAGAVRLGVSRALEAMEPGLRPVLSRAGMLSRDPRMVERKKPGQKKARKKFQWVKR